MIGLLGKKKGMSAIFEGGKHIPVTVIEAGPCPVVQVKNQDKDGYDALQIAYDPVKPKHVNKPSMGHFNKANVQPHRRLRELRNYDGEHKVGDVINIEVFKPGDVVDISGISKGRGTAGVIKRHNFHRPNQTHGTHEIFRGGGSIGQASYPARVWPGMKMAGRMGASKVTIRNLKVLRVDSENSLMVVKGAVPGATGGYLFIRKNR